MNLVSDPAALTEAPDCEMVVPNVTG